MRQSQWNRMGSNQQSWGGTICIRTLLGPVINGPLHGHNAKQCENVCPAVTVQIGVEKIGRTVDKPIQS